MNFNVIKKYGPKLKRGIWNIAISGDLPW